MTSENDWELSGLFISDGYDSPVGSDEQRRGSEVWPGGWFDTTPFGIIYFKGTPRESYSVGASLNWGRSFEAKGLPVYATASGEVSFVGRLPVWGNVIVIRHFPLIVPGGQIMHSRYGHVQNISVAVGERIRRGQKIAAVGDAFGTIVPLLHFSLSPTTVLAGQPQDWPGKDRYRVVKDYVDSRQFILNNRPPR